MTRILSQRQFAEASSLSRSTIERLWRAGRIERVQLSDRRFGYPASQLDALMKPSVKMTRGEVLGGDRGKTLGRSKLIKHDI